MESTSKYDVFLHEDIDDFDDKTLAASIPTSGRHRSLERWKSGGRGEGGGKTSEERTCAPCRGPVDGRSRELRDGFRNTRGFYERNVQTHSGNFNKPETYVCVCVHDDVTMTWGGEEQPCALGTLKSIGGINSRTTKR